jgi:hypothetical protein
VDDPQAHPDLFDPDLLRTPEPNRAGSERHQQIQPEGRLIPDVIRVDAVDLLKIRRPVQPRIPRHRPGEKFLRGPIPWKWLIRAGRLPGKALQVGLLLWQAAGEGLVRINHRPGRCLEVILLDVSAGGDAITDPCDVPLQESTSGQPSGASPEV